MRELTATTNRTVDDGDLLLAAIASSALWAAIIQVIGLSPFPWFLFITQSIIGLAVAALLTATAHRPNRGDHDE